MSQVDYCHWPSVCLRVCFTAVLGPAAFGGLGGRSFPARRWRVFFPGRTG